MFSEESGEGIKAAQFQALTRQISLDCDEPDIANPQVEIEAKAIIEKQICNGVEDDSQGSHDISPAENERKVEIVDSINGLADEAEKEEVRNDDQENDEDCTEAVEKIDNIEESAEVHEVIDDALEQDVVIEYDLEQHEVNQDSLEHPQVIINNLEHHGSDEKDGAVVADIENGDNSEDVLEMDDGHISDHEKNEKQKNNDTEDISQNDNCLSDQAVNDNNSEIDIPVESVIPPVESPEDDFGDGDDFGDFGDDDFGDFGGEGDDFGDFGDAPAEDQFADFGNFNDPPSEPLQSDLVPVSMSSIWDEIESSTNSAVTAPEPDPAGLPGGTGWQDEEEIIKRLFDCLNAVSLNLIWKKSNFSHIVEEAKPKLIQMSQGTYHTVFSRYQYNVY